jgi:mannose-6-phosphate isomerase-like protein (cupin superfamily)
MTTIFTGSGVPALPIELLDLLPAQGCLELQRDAPGKVHDFHTHPVDEILLILAGSLRFSWGDQHKVCYPGDKIFLPAGTRHKSEALGEGAVYAICVNAVA